MCRFSFVEEKFDNDQDIKFHKDLLYRLDEEEGYLSSGEAKEVVDRLMAGENLEDIKEEMFFKIF